MGNLNVVAPVADMNGYSFTIYKNSMCSIKTFIFIDACEHLFVYITNCHGRDKRSRSSLNSHCPFHNFTLQLGKVPAQTLFAFFIYFHSFIVTGHHFLHSN